MSFKAGSVYENDREITDYMKFVCSKCQIAGSLKDIQKQYIIQPQLLKREIAHDSITLSNYGKLESLWKVYLIDDVLGLDYVIRKHENAIQKLTGVAYKNSFTESSLAWSCLGRYLKDLNKNFHTLQNKYVRVFLGKTVHVGRLICLYRKFVSSSFDKVFEILGIYYGFNLKNKFYSRNILIRIKKFKKIKTTKLNPDLTIIDKSLKTLLKVISIKNWLTFLLQKIAKNR